ncbi:DinB family protein [Streptomyces sp. NBC_01481]|uniref:DinB family protein n=1 Tax=unclassified Streptomyces TaxID=2593676 RepID=UPI0022587C4A|nr:DinB family protein [Streptomyces sp. NBC_01481]MCX4587495.1 DinB family protein [Streptomyces sp. NBC_01481]
MTTPERIEPATAADERTMLDGWLDYHRATLELKCAGLDDEQLRTASAAPSTLSLLGLVRHMAEVERHWFPVAMAGEEHTPIYYSKDDPDGDINVTEADTWAEGYATWQAEIARARQAVAGRSLDELSVKKDRRTGELFNLRWIYTHMIEEYARHNGHADLLRERIDGATGE